MTDPFGHDPIKDIEKMFHQQTFAERMKLIARGLKADKDSGDYKKAKFELQRFLSPLAAILIPVLLLALIIVLAKVVPEDETKVSVEVTDIEEPPELEEPPEEIIEPIESPEPVDVEFENLDVVFDQTVEMQTPDDNPSPSPADVDAVALVKSPVTLTGIYGNRTPGARGSAMRRFGGNSIAEGAVMRALRWLKKNQSKNGSWPSEKYAMTSLALLTFMAHGETPDSEEFGETVQNAIKFLVANGKRAPARYSCEIVAYAMCEAYGLTKIPAVKEVAEYSLNRVIKGQNPTGGWDYGLKGTETRNDTSVDGWAIQALKAAKMAGIHHPDFQQSWSMAIKGIQANSNQETGHIGYTGPRGGNPGLTGAGVLALQFLGAAKTSECRKGINYLKGLGYIVWDGDKKTWMGGSPIYYWYYITQAIFQEDAERSGQWWRSWNNEMQKNLVKNQIIEKDAYQFKEEEFDIGHWVSPSESEHGNGTVQYTTMCTLMLEVYYRYLPTFKPPQDLGIEEDLTGGDGEITIDIDI
ncbi:MAG: terpene cyclase/mutase family protein [Kiritimatiellae bacterium]|jgi:hypothetical protein|nr:terpene cyclase/mutase family protein [Kiritimatiellia bacterium]